MSTNIVSDIRKEHINQLAEHGMRIDGRKMDEFRRITIEKGMITSAEGSARVKMGGTDVLVGVKMAIGEPFPDTPEMGVLTTSAELIPMASPTFEAGPPGQNSIELARVVDRGIRESGTVPLSKLCMVPGEKVWVTFVDIHVLDYAGNLFDASSLAAVAALTHAVVPASRFDLGEDFNMPVECYPISCTAVKIGNSILLDPSLDEENIADARLTVVTDENGNVRAMQKGLRGGFTCDEVKNIISMALSIGKKVREHITGAVQ